MKSASPISQATRDSFAGSHGAAVELGRQWRSGNAPALEDFLTDWSSDELRPAVSARELAELVTLDQRQRWHRGQRPAAEDYLQLFPQLLSDDELALDVIAPSEHRADLRLWRARWDALPGAGAG